MKARYEQLADDLKDTILRTDPGTKLSSVRQIARASGVSHLTVSRAMDLLEEQGFVVRRSAVGIYSSRPDHKNALPDTHTRRIVVMVPNIYDMAFFDILRRVLTERGYLHRVRYYDLREPPEQWLPRANFEGMIFLGSCPPEILSAVRKRNIPFVCQGLRYAHQEVDNTCGDERLVGAMAAKHLADLGHRQIAVLHNEPHTPDGLERVRGFLNQARLMDLSARVLDAHAELGCDSRQTAAERFRQELDDGQFNFTGLFVITDKGAMGVLHECFERGIKVPDQLSVVGCDDIPEAAYMCPALTTLAFDRHDRCRGLVDILEQRFAGDQSPAIQKIYEPELIVRKSTGKPR